MSADLDVLFVEVNTSNVYQELADLYSAIETPTWSLLLAESCRSKGYAVNILDCNAERLSDTDSVIRISEADARLVCFVVYGQNPNSGTTNMSAATRVAEKLKATVAEQQVMFIGSHASALPAEVLQQTYVDFVAINEGVYTLHDLLSGDRALHEVRGLGYKERGEVRFGAPGEVVPQERLDADLPGYAWDLLPYREKPLDLYRAHFWHTNYCHETRTPFAAIYTSLGCSFQCSFCMINIVNRTSLDERADAGDSNGMRHWSAGAVSNVIRQLDDLGVKNIRLSDEMFFLNRKYYEPIVEDLIELDAGLNLWSYSRVDTINEKLLRKIKRAGFNWIGIGIESGNQEVRQEISKGSFRVLSIRDVLDEVRAVEIGVGANYIFGFPHDNLETMTETLELAKSINAEFTNVYPCMALPGSPIYTDAVRRGESLPTDYSEYGFLSYDCKPLPTQHLSNQEVLRFRDQAWHELHTAPRFLDMIETRFGGEAKQNILDQTKVRLKRKILGD